VNEIFYELKKLPAITLCLPNWAVAERSLEVPFTPLIWPLISTRDEYAFGVGVTINVFSAFHLIVGGRTTITFGEDLKMSNFKLCKKKI
jgi:hypothetical protein